MVDTGNHSVLRAATGAPLATAAGNGSPGAAVAVNPDGNITTAAAAGTAGFSGDEAPAVSATLNAPDGVAADDNGVLYIADTGNNRIRQVNPDGVIHTIPVATQPRRWTGHAA